MPYTPKAEPKPLETGVTGDQHLMPFTPDSEAEPKPVETDAQNASTAREVGRSAAAQLTWNEVALLQQSFVGFMKGQPKEMKNAQVVELTEENPTQPQQQDDSASLVGDTPLSPPVNNAQVLTTTQGMTFG
jgi:hypothetical protein